MSGLVQKPLITEVATRPLTSAIITGLLGIWFLVYQRGIGYDDAGLNYERIAQGQWWRILTSQVTHVSFIHLAFNVSSLWSVGWIETVLLPWPWVYLKITFLLLVLSGLITVLIYHVLAVRFRLDRYLRVFAVGYSAVLFGWMSVIAVLQPTSAINILGLQLPMNFAPFGSLFFTSIIVPQASFIGHLAGIIAGYLIGWGAFSWLTNYWFFNVATWGVIATVVSVYKTTSVRFPFLSSVSWPDSAIGSSAVILNGILVRS